MKFSQILTSAILPLSALASRRYDLGGRRNAVAELDGTEKIDVEYQEIEIPDPDSGLQHVFRCPRGSGTRLSFTEGKKYVACCDASQHLSGSPDTAFECCGEGHDITGSKETGYTCCPTGQKYDGKKCYQPKPDCRNGKVLVGGECACPSGTKEAADGTCKQEDNKDNDCDSGIREGKCYTIRMENGKLLGYHKAGWYTASTSDRNHMFGKFKFCKSKACDGKESINPSDGFRIRDIHGIAESGERANEWLDNRSGGGHITKTPDYEKAGIFSLTKWSCGKYCLTGFDKGISGTCPSADPAITFSKDKQACQPVEIVEVPCDIRDNANNCLWKKKEGTC